MQRIVLALLACVMLLTNSFTMLETKDRLYNDNYVYGAANPDPISTPQGPARSSLRMTLFSNFIGVAGVVNISGIDEAVSVKGSLSDAFGNGLTNREIGIYVNKILMGKARTGSEGCFYFNDWSKHRLKPILDEYSRFGLFRIKITALFHGDYDYRRSFAYKYDRIYTVPPSIPVPNNYILYTKAEVKAGSSVDVPIVMTIEPYQVMLNVTLSLDAVPCKGVSAFVTPSFFPKTGNAVIHISTDSNLETGHYTLVIIGEAILKNLTTGDEKHLKEPFGLSYLTVSKQK